jgi:hypothetical protein
MMGEMPDRQMRLTPQWPGSAADSARARRFIEQMRQVLAKYQDVRVAEHDGFKQWLQGTDLPYFHFTSWHRALEAMVSFDPARPTSLLYAREADGTFRLLGAMYTAPATKTDEELNALIPLSLARWHQHVNWCVPRPEDRNRWPETRYGEPIHGITTLAACDSVGGIFRQRISDWMIHVYAFASDDPRAIWCVDRHDAKGEGE